MSLFDQNATISFYGDSISDYRSFGTYNISLYRDLNGTARFVENPDIGNYVDLAGRPGWDLAVAGTTVTDITQRFTQLVPYDNADIVVVLMGANNYGSVGPGTAQDWIDRANDIVAAAAAANKILVILPPISHVNDPIDGREVLKSYLPTIASSTVIVPDTAPFDYHVDTDDGVHPNQIGADLLAHEVLSALYAGDIIPAQYQMPDINDPAVNLVTNGALNGTGGTVTNGDGDVADGWTLSRITGAGTIHASKGSDSDGNPTESISYTDKGLVRLEQQISVDAHAGEQYEVDFKIHVDDPNHAFLGAWAIDGDKNQGTQLFSDTLMDSVYQDGTGSFDSIFRSPQFTLNSDDTRADLQIELYFGQNSGATVDISDISIVKIADTPPGYVAPIPIDNSTPDSEDTILTNLLSNPNTLTLTDSANKLVSHSTTGISILAGDGIDTITGGSGDDVIAGEGGNDKLSGANGDDTLLGGIGNDSLNGGNGDDIIYGGEGNDNIIGGNGNDYIDGGAGNDNINGGSGNNILHGGDGADKLLGGNGNDTLYGEDLNDTLTGGGGDDVLIGGAGNDNLNGGDGNDNLNGGGDNDHLIGGAGNDILDGGFGADILTGGTGADTFVFTSIDALDKITDFRLTDGDKIDVSGLLQDVFTAGDPIDDFLKVVQGKASADLFIDISGTGQDFVHIAQLIGAHSLPGADALVSSGALLLSPTFPAQP